MKKTPKIDKYLTDGEVIIYRAKTSVIGGLPHIFIALLGLVLNTLIFYSFICYLTTGYYYVEISSLKTVLDNIKFQDLKLMEFYHWIIYAMQGLGGIFALFLFFFKIQVAIKMNTRETVVTNQRLLIYERGFLNFDTFRYKLLKISEVSVTQSLMGKLFNYGKLVIATGVEIGEFDGYLKQSEMLEVIENTIKELKDGEVKDAKKEE